jgi:hypothetical protein
MSDDPDAIVAAARRAAELFRTTPGRIGSVVHLPATAGDVLALGDLHGHLHTFERAVAMAGLDANPTRHLVLQEVVHDPRVDPDSGLDLSHRLVDRVARLKIAYPDRVHLVLGNHELSELTGRSIGKRGVFLNALFRVGMTHSFGGRGGAVLEAYRVLFAALPVAVRTPNRVMLCHSLPNGAELDRFDASVLATAEPPPEALAKGGSIYAITWGRDSSVETVDRFARLVDADLFITGHQPCDEGFRAPNPRQLILDSTEPKPTACLFPGTGPIRMSTLLAGIRSLEGGSATREG